MRLRWRRYAVALAIAVAAPAAGLAAPASVQADSANRARPLAPATVARALAPGIEVEGSKEFKEKVQKALDDLKGTKTGKAVVEKLERSKNTHKIKETKVKKGSGNTPDDSKKAGDGTGTGSTTKWEPNGTEKYDEDVNRDPNAALLHELVHACDADQGTRDPDVDKDSGIKKNEIKATKKENEYRKEKGLDERQKYGGKPLPK